MMLFFFPKTIEIRTSKINGEIRVVKMLGKLSVQAGGFTQSGGLVYAIWESVLQQIQRERPRSSPRVLILGLGAGSAALIASRLWPASRIIGIELDPVMLELGRQYFQLKDSPRLRIINADAIEWVGERANTSGKRGFDLILVDLYRGGEPEAASRGQDFLKALRRLLTPRGVSLFNILIKNGEPQPSQEFKQKLEGIFSRVERLRSPANAVFAAHK